MLAIAVVFSVLSLNAWGSTYKVIYNFTGGQDGGFPVDAGNLAIDANGNLYGTTLFGGSCGLGTLLELSPNGGGGWTESVIHSFCGQDGAGPTAAPWYDSFLCCGQVRVVGTTTYGGNFAQGTTFAYVLGPGFFSDSLQCSLQDEGCFPYTTPIELAVQPTIGIGFFDTFYGGGAYGHGFLQYDDGETTYSFCSLSGCADGSAPASALAFDSNVDAFGTTNLGGTSDQGVVYECAAYIDQSGFLACNYSVLHSFAGGPNDGAYPFFATPTLTQSCGVGGPCQQIIWGTTPLGGAFGGNAGYGTIWAINIFGTFSLVHSFNLFDGASPFAGLTSLNGTFYGTTNTGGYLSGSGRRAKFGRGTIYSMTTSGTLITLHVFTGPDGAVPYSGLVADPNGNFYGVTFSGGAHGYGVVYEITP